MDKKTKELVDKGIMLPLMEEFYTIQGEGSHTGTAAYFIRVGGCDVGCHWCDVKESWNADLHPPTLADTIVKNVTKHANTVVITGGEPLMWPMDYITELLQKNNIRTHIETSGAYSFSGKWDWFCLSPKKTKLPLEECYPEADELKMIIHNLSDFDLQPEWSKKEKMTSLIVDYVMKNPKWKISLQTHKYLNIP